MQKSPLSIINRFFIKHIRKKKYRQNVKREASAVKIQRAFRSFLLRREFRSYYINKCAHKIQSFYRKFLRSLKNSETKRANFLSRLEQICELKRLEKQQYLVKENNIATNEAKRKTLHFELPPPWKNKKKNSLTQAQIDELIAKQNSDVKWIKQMIIPKLMSSIFSNITNRNEIKLKNQEYMDRIVSKTFYTLATRSIHAFNHVINIHFHESTFRVLVVHNNGVSVISINNNRDESIKFYPSFIAIIDSVMDKPSGRLILLLKNWSISAFEYCFITKPRALVGIPKPVLPQKKYLIIDKFGYVYIILSQKYNSVYMLDSLCFSLLTTFNQFDFYANGKISMLYPIFKQNRIIGFYATCNSLSQFSIFDDKENRVSTINSHTKFTPSFFVNQNYVITYAKDKLIIVYKRTVLNNEPKLTEITKIKLASEPLCIDFIKGMSLLAVGLSDCTFKLITFSSSESYNLTIPPSMLPSNLSLYVDDVIGEHKITTKCSQYSCILSKKFNSAVKQIYSTHFSPNCAFFTILLSNNQVFTFWLYRRKRKIKCSSFDIIDTPPTQMIPSILATQIAEIEYNKIFHDVSKVRDQLTKDGIYIKTVGKEFEKRFIIDTFMKKSLKDAVSILFQSPYSRWIKWLKFCERSSYFTSYYNSINYPNNSFMPSNNFYYSSADQIKKRRNDKRNQTKTKKLTIYEIYCLVSKFDVFVPSLNTVEKFNIFLIESMPEISMPSVGPFASTIGTIFSPDELVIGFGILHAIIGSQFTDYQSLKMIVLSLELTIPSIQMKSIVRNFNGYALLRLTEIENIVRNKIRDESFGSSIEKILGTAKKGRFAKYKNQKEEALKTEPKVTYETFSPIVNKKNLKKSSFVLPNPLFESFCFKNPREISVSYYSYGKEYPAAKLITLKEPMRNVDEILLARPLAKMGVAVDIAGITDDHNQLLMEYPINFIPLCYILSHNPFKCGIRRTLTTALFWLSRVLVHLNLLHRSQFLLRAVLPENILVSNDGNDVKFDSISEFAIQRADFKPVSYESPNSPWLPPEYWAKQSATPAFDIYQFGILLVVVLTGFVPSSFGDIIAQHTRFRKENTMDIAKSKNFFYDPLNGFPFSEFRFFTAKGNELENAFAIYSKSSLMDVAISCLDIDPLRRPTAKQLLELPFFKFTPQGMKNAQHIGFSLIRKIPISFVADTIFTKLPTLIEKTSSNDPLNVQVLESSIDIVNFFINKDDSGVKLILPIDQTKLKKISNVIYKQNFFDKIISYVMEYLQYSFEKNVNVKSDILFSKIIDIFKISRLNPDISNSFVYFCTGIKGDIDSHRLFIFLHDNLRKLVEKFFKQANKEVYDKLKVTKFYCAHFLQFYDNSRDFAKAYSEHSGKHHVAAINFFSTFIANYPTSDTMRLLVDFKIQHKIEHSLCYSNSDVRIAALDLFSHVMELASFDKRFFDGVLFHFFPVYLESDLQIYDEKMAMMIVVKEILFSKSVPAIIALLSTGILNTLIDLIEVKPERVNSSVWGVDTDFPITYASLELIRTICTTGNVGVISVIYTDEQLSESCVRYGIFQRFWRKTYEMLICEMRDNGRIDESLVTTLKSCESTSLITITAMTKQSQQSFESSLYDICDFFVQAKEIRYNYDQLFQSVLKICYFHNFSIYESLFTEIADGIRNNYIGHIEMAIQSLSIMQYPKLPSVFLEFTKVWYDVLKKQFEEIVIAIQSTSKYPLQKVIQNYHNERMSRHSFLKVLLEHPDNDLNSDFALQTNFPEYIVNILLSDESKFAIELQVVPPSFAKYNNTYPLRSEIISFLKLILNNREKCASFFKIVSKTLHQSNFLEREAERIKRINDQDFRKNVLRLLSTLLHEDDAFLMNTEIMQSNALKALKEISIEEWEDIEMKRGVMNLELMKKNRSEMKDIKKLYDSFIW